MAKARSRRKKLSAESETQLLVACRRRCCACAFLDGNFAVRSGQIAHLDQDRGNNALDNLAWLCLEHHDAYDSTTSQSKGMTQGELRRYRDELVSLVRQETADVVLPWRQADERTTVVSSGSLLGRILESYDRESLGLQRGAAANGVALAHLAATATNELGDFAAAVEAYLSILRLASEAQRRSERAPSLDDQLPSANTLTAAARTLEVFARTDFSLFLEALRRSRTTVLMGDIGFRDLPLDSSLPSDALWPFAVVLYRSLCRSTALYEESRHRVMGELAILVVATAVHLTLTGREVPDPPTELVYDLGGVRRLDEANPDVEVLRFVWLASLVAELPEEAFVGTLERIAFRQPLRGVQVSGSSDGPIQEALEWVRRWSYLQSSEYIVPLQVACEQEANVLRQAIAEATSSGCRSAARARAFIEAERRLLAGPTARIAGSQVRVRLQK